jgi:uncharacterized membrane protein
MALKRWPVPGLIVAGIAGSLTNTILVLGMIGAIGHQFFPKIIPVAPWPLLLASGVTNGPFEAGAAALLTLVVVAAWQQIEIGRKRGANL